MGEEFIKRDEGVPIEMHEPATNASVRVRDRRKAFPEETAPPPLDNAIRAMSRHRAKPTGSERLDLLDIQAPGGLGAGVVFKDGQLLFSNASAVFYYLVYPRQIAASAGATLLYMTSSNRASKGCEALLHYDSSNEWDGVFRIWDWSSSPQPNGSQFVFNRAYDELTDYLVPYNVPTDMGTVVVDTLYIVSSTSRIATGDWVNEVFLWHPSEQARDLVYSNNFMWPTKGTDVNFSWGPIFETFPEAAIYSPQQYLGFLEALMVQDGYEHQITSNNSELRMPVANGFNVVFRSALFSLVCN